MNHNNVLGTLLGLTISLLVVLLIALWQPAPTKDRALKGMIVDSGTVCNGKWKYFIAHRRYRSADGKRITFIIDSSAATTDTIYIDDIKLEDK